MKIKKGDQVQVIAGKDRGKRGTVSRVFPTLDKVIVEGANMGKRHRKAKTAGEKGERVELAMPIHVSNVMLVDPETGKPSRVGYRVSGTEKVRVSKKSGKDLN
ncbi:MAG: 50S ribosomal protein L24 [Candidatus Moraniibacteriota bacterium]|jgi:large subunit ribosomal protein L24|nr:MAG: 50S ribosomal protein L24 [Candidatus Moranbacteria bacterium]